MRSLAYRALLIVAWPCLPICHAVQALQDYDWWHLAEDYRRWGAAFRKGERLGAGE